MSSSGDEESTLLKRANVLPLIKNYLANECEDSSMPTKIDLYHHEMKVNQSSEIYHCQ